MAASNRVNIVIPMAGRGSRFANNMFVQPKPMIDVGGRPMITWVLDNIDSSLIEATFILLILKEQQDRFDLIANLGKLKPRMEFVVVDEVTEGAACTALLARRYIDNDDPMFIVNSDQFVEWDADQFWRDRLAANDAGVDGDVLCFHVPMENDDTKWSYAKLDEQKCITVIREKEVISSNATVGFYYWRRGRDYVESAEAMIAADDRVKGEFYVAPVYNYGVSKFSRKYTVSFCETMWGLGVPEDLVEFLSSYVRPRRAASGSGEVSKWHRVPVGHVSRSNGPLRFIAHRGNVDGRNPELENEPVYLKRALALGFDVQCDAWLDEDTNTWRLGNDKPQHAIDYSFLYTDGVWVQCKNDAALAVLLNDDRVHAFCHDRDGCTLTSRSVIWTSRDTKSLGQRSVAVMPSDPASLLTERISGICHDDVGPLREQYVRLRHGTAGAFEPPPRAGAGAEGGAAPTVLPVPPSGRRRIRLIIFDLDGVLVESRDLHYEAMNQALEEKAGKPYVITREEHIYIYDGLSTDQKLKMLSTSKQLDPSKHRAVWERKQELTEELVRKMLGPTEHITHTIKALKRRGFPIAVASNCIRSSVKTILETIGVLDYVDVYMSNGDVPYAKPDPDIYIATAGHFGLETHQALVIEDSTKGFEAASRAGCNLLKVGCPEDVTEAAILDRVFQLESLSERVTVVVPLAGPAGEVWLGGKTGGHVECPIFVSDASGRPALQWIVESLKSRRYDLHYVFVVKDQQCSAFKLESLCAAAVNYAPFKVVKIQTETLGSVKTILKCPSGLIPLEDPVLIADGHHVPEWPPGTSVDDLLATHADGALSVVTSSDPRWSYVRLLPGQHSTNRVAEVHMQRTPVSNLACTGLYYYRRAGDFFEAARALVARDERSRGLFYTAPTFNELIAAGKQVEIMRIPFAWSMRTAAEIRDFSQRRVPWMNLVQITEIYDEMDKRQSAKVTADGLSCDAKLHEKVDDRYCLAVYTLANETNFSATSALDDLLHKTFLLLGQGHCYYAPAHESLDRPPSPKTMARQISKDGSMHATLHWTLMQLIGFQVYGKVEVPEEYGEVVESVLQRHLPSLTIHFSRVIVTPGNMLLCGYPSADVNEARRQLRAALLRSGLPLFEPYLNDITHVTLVRFASPVAAAVVKQLQELADKASGVSLGSLTVKKMELSPSTWRMQPAELDKNPRRTIQLL